MFSSGTLGFCFIFRFLFIFGYDGTFTHVFWPMQGSLPRIRYTLYCYGSSVLSSQS
jgi:hypothetical protein